MALFTEAIGFFIFYQTGKAEGLVMPDLRTSVGRMRVVGMIEGVSFLLLMGVAMPLKYMAGMPVAVKWAGWIHGILFILYCLTILMALVAGRITFRKSVLAFIASLLPMGPFLLDRGLAEQEAVEESTT